MPELDLSPQEALALRDILATALSELRTEIRDTDGHEFRESLKSRERVIEAVLARLS